MKTLPTFASLLAAICLTTAALAGGPGELIQAPAGYEAFGGDYCDSCDPCCGHRHCGHHCQRKLWYQQNSVFNCGCNGSYKFPVPPLYTYHWPGMYSAQLMTDYVSPWRFPPLKPYAEEIIVDSRPSNISLRRVQHTSPLTETSSAARPTSFSDHVENSLR